MKINIHSKIPFFIFSFDSDISQQQCQSIRNDIINLNFTKSDSGEKFRIEHNDVAVFRLTKTNQAFKEILRKLNGLDFQNEILTIIKQHDKNHTAYDFISLNPFKNFLNFYFLNKKPLRLNFEFSRMGNGSFITPHTDSRNKKLTMMLYLPDSVAQESKNIGTVFYKPIFGKENKYSNFNNLHVNKDSYPDFFLDTKKIFTTRFTHETIYAFIKNDLSWHGVEKLQLDPEEKRVSINLNYYQSGKSVVGPLVDLLKKYIKSYIYR